MDHSEVRAILEDAAIEPNGLERLMAGDTPNASLVAGHLAGCAECAEELERLRGSVGIIGPAIRAVPSPELRERTLAFVAAVGRPRGATADARDVDDAVASAPAVVAPAVPERSMTPRVVPFGRPSRLGPLLGLAAVLVFAVTGTAFVANAQRDRELTLQAAEVEALGEVARWTFRIDGQADVQRVALAAAPGAAATPNQPAPNGTLIFSANTAELVVVADGLPVAPSGQEYRCWVELNGNRTSIGKMFFGGSLAYWVGPVHEATAIAPNARFGVTLLDPGSNAPGRDVLVSGG